MLKEATKDPSKLTVTYDYIFYMCQLPCPFQENFADFARLSWIVDHSVLLFFLDMILKKNRDNIHVYLLLQKVESNANLEIIQN